MLRDCNGKGEELRIYDTNSRLIPVQGESPARDVSMVILGLRAHFRDIVETSQMSHIRMLCALAANTTLLQPST
jgi:hypothetical protein